MTVPEFQRIRDQVGERVGAMLFDRRFSAEWLLGREFADVLGNWVTGVSWTLIRVEPSWGIPTTPLISRRRHDAVAMTVGVWEGWSVIWVRRESRIKWNGLEKMETLARLPYATRAWLDPKLYGEVLELTRHPMLCE